MNSLLIKFKESVKSNNKINLNKILLNQILYGHPGTEKPITLGSIQNHMLRLIF